MSNKDGKVADVENAYTLVITCGRNRGVQIGDIYSVKESEGVPVLDPDSKEEIGRRYPEKLRVKVIEVDENFCRASTYRNVGGMDMEKLLPASLGAFARRQRIDSSSQVGNPVVTVNVGDRANWLPASAE